MLLFVMVLFMVVSSITAANVYVVAIGGIHLRSNTDIIDYSENVHIQNEILLARRGNILDRNGIIIAEDVDAYHVYAVLDGRFDETYVTDIEATSVALADYLNAPVEYIRSRLSVSGAYQTYFGIYGRNLSKSQKTELETLGLDGIKFQKTVARNYPFGTFASHLIGFAQAEDENGNGNVLIHGKMGLELGLENRLVGVNGKKQSTVDRYGYVLPGSKVVQADPVDGYDVTLTLDKGIQEALEAAMFDTRDAFETNKIWGSVMEVDSGKILAWSQWPGFDPNVLDIEDYMNIGSQYAYEPGSTMKTFVYASAIDTGVYNGNTIFDSSPFRMGIKNGQPIRVNKNQNAIAIINNANNKNWGLISLDYGYIYSSNVGIAEILTKVVDTEVYRDYLDDFGFFKPVDTDSIPEVTGSINYQWPVEKLTAGYGQGVTVTMLQMLQAYSAVFSDGTMVKPYVVASINDPETGEPVYTAETTVVGHPIQEDTAHQLQQLMYQVVYDQKGTGRFYQIPEVNSIAKTGTAQIAVNGSYEADYNLFSVALAIPAENPKIMIYYAFEAEYARNVHSTTSPLQQLMRKITLAYGFTKPTTDPDDDDKPKVFMTSVPFLTNHSLGYADAKCTIAALACLTIGNGKSVVAQYPLPETQVLSDQRVFLLTSQENILMPNMTGWSRRDVLAFFALTHVPVTINGEGNVSSQSVAVNTALDASVMVEITLK